MKRTLALLAASALVATPVVAEAAAKKPAPKPTKRVVTWNYTGLHGVTVPGAVSTGFENPCTVNASGCYTLPTQAHETKVTFAESKGAKVAFQYFLDDDYSGVQTVCTGGAVPVKKGTTVSFISVVDPTCTGVPTTGAVTITVTGKK